jgi:hypothetical protein
MSQREAASKPDEVSREEMHAVLSTRIWRAHRMTVEEYFEAKRLGTLQRKPADAGIEVFSGEYAHLLSAL